MIAAVTFLDHVEDGTEPMKITAYGVIEETRDNCIILNSWIGGDDHQHNNKRFCIVSSCIISIRELHEGKARKIKP